MSERKEDKKKLIGIAVATGGRKEGFIMTIKYCTKCGKQFYAIGRQVICPDCKAAAEEDAKRAAVERAKRASWAGESVPVRISGRASTIIRRYGAANGLPFAESLDALLQNTPFFQSTGKAWEDITPYKSRRRDKHATETADKPQDAPQATQAAKATSTAKKAVKKVATAAGKKAAK